MFVLARRARFAFADRTAAKQVKSVYLNAIPRTATATDVLHALRDNKLVSNDFSVKNSESQTGFSSSLPIRTRPAGYALITTVTSSAISLPRSRQYSLTRQWHVSLPSNKDATAVHHAVRYDRGSSDPSSGGLFPGFFAPSFISPAQYTTDTGKQFRVRQREHQADMMAHAQKTRALREGREGGQAGREQNDKWTLDDGVNFDGKGVLLVGMPLGAGRNDVKSLLSHRLFGEWKKEASQLGLLQSDDGITKLPA